MNRLKLIIVLGFAIMFVAGLAVGRSRPGSHVPKPPGLLPNFRDQLGLTPVQEQQMGQIWRDARTHADALSQHFREYDRQRDEGIAKLLSPEQKQRDEQIMRERDARVAALRQEIAKTFHDAENSTRPLLTPQQLKIFDDMVKDHHHHGPPPPMGMGHHHHRGPESMPAEGPGTMPGT